MRLVKRGRDQTEDPDDEWHQDVERRPRIANTTPSQTDHTGSRRADDEYIATTQQESLSLSSVDRFMGGRHHVHPIDMPELRQEVALWFVYIQEESNNQESNGAKRQIYV